MLCVAVFAVMLLLAFQPFAMAAHGNEYLEQLADKDGISSDGTAGWHSLEEWIAGMLIKIIEFLQNISPLVIIFAVFIGAILLLVGSLFNSVTLRGAGGAGILAALFAYIVIRNAPAILLIIQDLAVGGQ